MNAWTINFTVLKKSSVQRLNQKTDEVVTNNTEELCNDDLTLVNYNNLDVDSIQKFSAFKYLALLNFEIIVDAFQ